MSAQTPPVNPIRDVDLMLLNQLRDGDARGITQLTSALGVTATAVRQRVERLLIDGSVQRHKLVAGRGRPTFEYSITAKGQRRIGADMARMADALWHAVIRLPDDAVRNEILRHVAIHLGRQLSDEAGMTEGPDESVASSTKITPVDESRDSQSNMTQLAARMRAVAASLVGDRVAVGVRDTELQAPASSDTANQPPQHGGSNDSSASAGRGLPVLDIHQCPYPALANPDEHRAMCQLEETMLSEALGHSVELTCCKLDGDASCQFTPVTTS
ncbi:MAG: ArsR family transcriptional regulator [Planctomycetota bacterium]